MAGWIKWNKGLAKRSEVLQMAARTKKDRRAVALACMELWEWADDETTDGRLPGCTTAFVDDLVGIRGFAVAYAAAGWAAIDDDGITLLNWERHNGESAKRRALDARSKEDRRTHVRKVSASDADKSRTSVRIASGQSADQIREEKKREEQQQSFPLCAGSSATTTAVACPPAAAPAAADSCPILQALHERGIGEPTATTLRDEGCTQADIRAADKAHGDGDGPGLVVNRIRESMTARAATKAQEAIRTQAVEAWHKLDPAAQAGLVASFRRICADEGRDIRHMADGAVAAWRKFTDWFAGEWAKAGGVV